MSFFLEKIGRVKENCYSNKGQIRTVILTRAYIKNNYHKDVDLDLLSRLHLTSKYHLLRLFRQYYGITIRQYLIDTRIENAKLYLGRGMSVTETCFAVGYNSLSSFITLFKTKTGVTPAEYQKQQFSISTSPAAF
ncbi:helix-turn-helix domain-containing protein [Rhodohalobacter mucosus]|uniref:AraC family transcriptional regulator n=1 Tax=Rhodohalobacter mucosus TaxID=2079485 RepID=A0A316TSF8_9BACT|nr:AraC family transcriptional regulator [Rhodohalobacter mucosus]